MTEILPRVTVAMLGSRMHYAVPRFIQEAGMLEYFYTDNYIGNKPLLEALFKAIPDKIRPAPLRRFLGRNDLALPTAKVASFETLGLSYAWRSRLCSDSHAVQRELQRDIGRRFGLKVLRKGFGNSDLLVGFSGASLEMFRGAKEQGLKCILEQTILPDQPRYRLLYEEIKKWPGWEPQSKPEDFLSTDFCREEEEWQLADVVVAGSDFVKDGLVECGVSPNKVHVVPYGVEATRFFMNETRSILASEPLRVLFVGNVCLRKGVPYLLEALGKMDPTKVQARFVGKVSLDQDRLEEFGQIATFTGPIPRNEMAGMYQWADVFCLPSVVEGSATVIYEALMSGLPVITTPNTGSLVRDGVDGHIVPIRSSGSLVEAIESYARDRSLLQRPSQIFSSARERVSMDRYKREFISVIQKA